MTARVDFAAVMNGLEGIAMSSIDLASRKGRYQ
jgi:hypothetical protein